MKLETVIKALVLLVLTIVPIGAWGQSANANYPDQWAIINMDGGEVTSKASKNTAAMAGEVAELHIMAQMLARVEKWNREYNEYLKDTLGLVSAIKAAPILYTQGATLLENLYLLKKAIDANPEGIAASVPMNNLYMETATMAVKCYKTLKETITKGGKNNMLTGAERAELLWKLAAEMKELNNRIRKTSISIAYYDLLDVWNQATLGMYEKDHKQIAEYSLKKWREAYRASRIFE